MSAPTSDSLTVAAATAGEMHRRRARGQSQQLPRSKQLPVSFSEAQCKLPLLYNDDNQVSAARVLKVPVEALIGFPPVIVRLLCEATRPSFSVFVVSRLVDPDTVPPYVSSRGDLDTSTATPIPASVSGYSGAELLSEKQLRVFWSLTNYRCMLYYRTYAFENPCTRAKFIKSWQSRALVWQAQNSQPKPSLSSAPPQSVTRSGAVFDSAHPSGRAVVPKQEMDLPPDLEPVSPVAQRVQTATKTDDSVHKVTKNDDREHIAMSERGYVLSRSRSVIKPTGSAMASETHRAALVGSDNSLAFSGSDYESWVATGGARYNSSSSSGDSSSSKTGVSSGNRPDPICGVASKSETNTTPVAVAARGFAKSNAPSCVTPIFAPTLPRGPVAVHGTVSSVVSGAVSGTIFRAVSNTVSGAVFGAITGAVTGSVAGGVTGNIASGFTG